MDDHRTNITKLQPIDKKFVLHTVDCYIFSLQNPTSFVIHYQI